jgi:hypothetical protein
MRKRDYFWTWAARSIGHSFGKADAVSAAIGIFGPLALQGMKVQRWHQIMSSDLIWQVPVGVFLTFLIVRLIMAPYWMHQDAEKAWTKETSDLRKELASYNDPTLFFGATKIEYEIGSAKHKSIARVSLTHNGSRSIKDTRVRVVGIAPISPNAAQSTRELCDAVVPFFLNTKFDCRDVFKLHNQHAPEWLDVAFTVKTVNILFLLRTKSGVGSDRPLPRGDYVIVLEASGDNAHPAIGAFLLGDRDEEMVFQPLGKPIGNILSKDHPLAKFDSVFSPPSELRDRQIPKPHIAVSDHHSETQSLPTISST